MNVPPVLSEGWLMPWYETILTVLKPTPYNVGEGVVIGVTAGLVLKLIEIFFNRRNKREQTIYIRKLLIDKRGQIYGLRKRYSADADEPNSEDFLRFVASARWEFYQELKFDLLSALQNRCVNMNYDQIASVRKALRLVEELTVKNQLMANLKVYRMFFESLEELEWLEFPAEVLDEEEDSYKITRVKGSGSE